MKPRESVLCHSAAATQELGVRLAGELAPGDTVALNGDLGAGKTCLIQGICRGLGVQDWVNSPTFILINEYRGRSTTSTSIASRLQKSLRIWVPRNTFRAPVSAS